MKKLIWIATLAVLLLPAGLALACPSCKDSIPNSDAEAAAALPAGFNMSVYYMLTGLFVTIGLVSTIIAKGVRNTNARMKIEREA